MCYSCKGMNLVEDTYEDWDDELELEVTRSGYTCKDCDTFMYEESDRIVCILTTSQSVGVSNLKGYIPEI